MPPRKSGNKFFSGDLLFRRLIDRDCQGTETTMKKPLTDESSQSLDRQSSRAICDAVGERLQQFLRPETTQTPTRLQSLLNEFQRRDAAND
jgi:hypothetical protein